MPNYGLVVTPQYNPMNYEQYAKPFEQYAQVYNQMADAFDALELEANQWEKLANSDVDSPQYEQYKRYANDLRAAASALSEHGLNPKTRGIVSQMRKRYAGEIKPIEEAYNYRQKLAEEQRKLNPKGDMQFDVDFSKIGLGVIMENPNLGYKGRSLSEMEQEGFEQAKAASSRRIITQKAKNMGNQYYQILQGYGKEAAAAFLRQAKTDNPTEYQELVNLYNQIREGYGTSAEDSPYSTEQNALADERILNGMMKGLALQDSYQTNHWALPGANRGSGDKTPSLEFIGHEITLAGQTYTAVDEAGHIKLYNENGAEVDQSRLPQAQKEALKTARIAGRYYTMPHNQNADLVYVYDAATGMPVTQSNGNVVSYNRKTQYWDAKTKTVMDIPGASKKNPKNQTQYKLNAGQAIVSKFTVDGTSRNADAIVKDEDTPKLVNGTIKTYDGTTFEGEDWMTNEELVDLYNKLPETVKANPSAYIIQYGRVNWSHDRALIARPKQNYSASPLGGGNNEEEDVSNETE